MKTNSTIQESKNIKSEMKDRTCAYHFMRAWAAGIACFINEASEKN